MILPFLLSASLWLPLGTVYTHLAEPEIAFTKLGAVFKHAALMFKQTNSFKPSEFQALNIKLDYGNSPEPQRLLDVNYLDRSASIILTGGSGE